MKEGIIGIIIHVLALFHIVGRGAMFGMIIAQCVIRTIQQFQFHINGVF